jgi:hypothetical protein
MPSTRQAVALGTIQDSTKRAAQSKQLLRREAHREQAALEAELAPVGDDGQEAELEDLHRVDAVDQLVVHLQAQQQS